MRDATVGKPTKSETIPVGPVVWKLLCEQWDKMGLLPEPLDWEPPRHKDGGIDWDALNEQDRQMLAEQDFWEKWK